jgi:2-keto-4-pentenoate hydratase/2-oxohepta-3-ene-1,7-dioic acid hydratase in catechol pathway
MTTYSLSRSSRGIAVELHTGPMLIRSIIGVGLNYAAHAHEQGKGAPERPVFFTKNPLACCTSDDAIVIPKACQDRPQVDFEAELGVVLGDAPSDLGTGEKIDTGMGGTRRLIKDVPVDRALECVLGYCVANDVSARWWQKEGSGGQFYRGKSFDTFCPISSVTSAAMIKDPQALRLTATLNGELMQDSNTSDMVFSVARLIAEASRGTTLLPGTLILTGTPSGVGFARQPAVYMKDGDEIAIEVEGLGVLKNRVRAEA